MYNKSCTKKSNLLKLTNYSNFKATVNPIGKFCVAWLVEWRRPVQTYEYLKGTGLNTVRVWVYSPKVSPEKSQSW